MQSTSTTANSILSKGNIWLVVMLLIGANQVIVGKFMNSAYVHEGPMYKNNFHPYIQTLNMFIGQMLSLPIFFILKKKNPEKYLEKQRQALAKGKKLNMNKLWIFIPCFFDILTSMMQYIAFNFISTSAYQILKGGTLVTTFLFTFIFLKQPITKKQLIGSILCLIGILIVGIANVAYMKQSSYEGNAFLQMMGYVLMIASLFTSGFFFIYEQRLLSQYYVEPLQIVGYEGVYGLIVCLILMPILCHIPCYFGPNACVYSYEGLTYMEGVSVYFHQLSQNPHLIALAIISVFGILGFNVSGVSVTKYINAIARAIANLTKSILVWILGIIITVTLGQVYPNYKWEKLEVGIILFQILGFIFMAFGNLIYTNIIKLPEKKDKNEFQSALTASVEDFNSPNIQKLQKKHNQESP